MNVFNIKKTFEMKKVKGWPEVYFCIDLHGTIIPSGKNTTDKYEDLQFYPGAREVLQYLTSRNDIFVILWTSTPKERWEFLLEWFRKNKIDFDFVNENPDAKDTPRSCFKQKFYFNVLLDDRAGFEAKTDWLLVKNELIAIGEWSDKQ